MASPMTSLPMDDGGIDLIDYWTPLLLRLSVDAGIFEAFGAEERAPADVAAQTGTDPDAVGRVVRALGSRGLFEERGDGLVALTPLGRRFLAGTPQSLAGVASFRPFEMHAWAEADHALRTGRPSFPEHFGRGYWDWMAANPAASAKFNEGMRRRTAGMLDAGLELYDWPLEGTIVDVGGGNGLLMERVLRLRPEVRGVVFDLPQAAVEAQDRLREAGLADRTEIASGDFFTGVPAGHELYVLASVLHDWNDEDALRILTSCRLAMRPASRLVLFEGVVRPGMEPDLIKMVDLHMLVLFGARERTRDEWDHLLRRAGFELTNVTPTPSLSWIEARPSPE